MRGGAGPPPGSPPVRKEHPHWPWRRPLQLGFRVCAPRCPLSHLLPCAWEAPGQLSQLGEDTAVWTWSCSDRTGKMAQTWGKMVLACLVLGFDLRGGLKAVGTRESGLCRISPRSEMTATPPSTGLVQRTPSAEPRHERSSSVHLCEGGHSPLAGSRPRGRGMCCPQAWPQHSFPCGSLPLPAARPASWSVGLEGRPCTKAWSSWLFSKKPKC